MADIGSTVAKTKRDGKIELITNERTLEVKYEAGDFSLSGLKASQMATTMILDRGDFHTVRPTDFEPVTGSFSCTLTDLSDGTDVLIIDACRGTGAWASDTSAFGAHSDVWGLKIRWTVEGTDHNDSADHTCVMEPVRVTSVDISEGDPSTFSISFECYAVPVLT